MRVISLAALAVLAGCGGGGSDAVATNAQSSALETSREQSSGLTVADNPRAFAMAVSAAPTVRLV